MDIKERGGEELQAFEMWSWRRMAKVSGKNRVTNEDVLGEKRIVLDITNGRKRNWLGHCMWQT